MKNTCNAPKLYTLKRPHKNTTSAVQSGRQSRPLEFIVVVSADRIDRYAEESIVAPLMVARSKVSVV